MRGPLLVALALAAARAQFSGPWPPMDGAGNNVANPAMNALFSPFSGKRNYGDGISSLGLPSAPNPRTISDTLISRGPYAYNRLKVSSISTAWGQFIAHDMIFTTPQPHASGADLVSVPCDAVDALCAGSANMSFTRTLYSNTSGTDASNPRQQLNAQTGWMDLSGIYGPSAASAVRLRAFVGGLLYEDPVNGLPMTSGRSTPCADAGMETGHMHDPCSVRLAGDVRANIAPGILSTTALFVLNHNWWARTLARRMPAWGDEVLFQEARKRNIAEAQVITWGEYLSALLGRNLPGLPPYTGYNPSVDARVDASFAVAAYRYGHSGINSVYRCIDPDGTECPAGDLLLRDIYFNPSYLTSGHTIGGILRGLTMQLEAEIDSTLVPDVRQFLIKMGGDLAAIDIFRGRDFGLPSFSQARVAVGLPPLRAWSDVTPDTVVQGLLDTLYDGDLSALDLWVGGIVEAGGISDTEMLGPTFRAIIIDQMRRSRDGDRFFYLNAPNLNTTINGVYAGPYFPPEDAATIAGTLLSKIVARNIVDWPSPPLTLFYVPSTVSISAGGSSSGSGANVLPSSASGNSSGPCSQAFSYADGKIVLSWVPPTAADTSITLTFTFSSGSGWLGFGIGSGMTSSDLYWMEYAGGAGRVTQGAAASYAQPTASSTQAVTLVSSKQSTSTTWVITRPLAASGGKTAAIASGLTKIIFAWSLTGSFGPHGSNYLSASVDFFSTAGCSVAAGAGGAVTSGATTSAVELLRTARLSQYSFHALTMFAVWGVLLPIAIFAVHFFPHLPSAYALHKWGAMLAATLTLPAAGSAIVTVSVGSTSLPGLDPTSHQQLGLTIAILMVFQVILGSATRNWMRSTKEPPRYWWLVRYAHRVLGYFEQIAAMVNIILGFNLIYVDVNMGWYPLGYFLLMIAAACGYGFYSAAARDRVSNLGHGTLDKDNARRFSIALSKQSMTMVDVRENVRAGCAWVLFQGLVVDVGVFMKHHPGGAYLLERNLGQDISSWFLGREAYDAHVPAHAHSASAQDMMRRMVVGALKTDLSRTNVAWGDAPNMPEESCTAQWTLVSSTMLRGERNRPVYKLVFSHPSAGGMPAVSWLASSFGRYMAVKVPKAEVLANLEAPDVYWRERGLNAALGSEEPAKGGGGVLSIFAAVGREWGLMRSSDTRGRRATSPRSRRRRAASARQSGASPRLQRSARAERYDDDGGEEDDVQPPPRRSRSESARGPSSSSTFSTSEDATIEPVSPWNTARGSPRAVAPAPSTSSISNGARSMSAMNFSAKSIYATAPVFASRKVAPDNTIALPPQRRFGPGASVDDEFDAEDVEKSRGLYDDTDAAATLLRGELIVRPYSIVRADDSDGLIMYIRRYPLGLMSRYLASLPVGARIEMAGPKGIGMGLDDSAHGVVVAIVQGTGVCTVFDLCSHISALHEAARESAQHNALPANPLLLRGQGRGETSVRVVHGSNPALDAADSVLFDGDGNARNPPPTPPLTGGTGMTPPPLDAIPPPPSKLRLVLMGVFEHENAIIEREWLVWLNAHCPDIEVHINLKRPRSQNVGSLDLPRLTTGSLTPKRLEALLPPADLLSVVLCGTPSFNKEVRAAYSAMGLPKSLVAAVG